ncbi:murein biosynthesis integral membrane protein MurJ [candidate division GN15 bacterium]|nr:murein biosynthesis integral membrane protein MurJ [candidate division GN15 bacterium]
MIGTNRLSTSKAKKTTLLGSVSVVAGATAFSRILGLIREQTMAYFFGASMATDAFVTAFRIPNLLRDLFAEGALSSAFVPVFKERMVRDGDKAAFSLAQIVITAVLVVVGAIVLLGIIAAPVIIFISANGFTAEPEKFSLTVDLTRLMFVYLLLVSLSSVVMGMLNSFGRFGIPALSPALFNVGIIGSVFALYHALPMPVYSLAIGVLVGGLGQLVVQLPPLFKLGFRFRLRFDFLNDALKRVIRLFLPMIAGMSAGRVNILVSTLLASFMIEGAITYLSYAYRLMHLPLGVFAVALGTVALPNASEQAARGDLDGVARTLREALGLNMFLVVPAGAFLALLGSDIVELIYQWGAFSALDTQQTTLALLHYSYGLIGFAAVRVIVPIYYALQDSKLPMRVSIIAVALNLVLYYPFIEILGFAGLAAATSIAALVNFGLLLYFLPRRGVPVRYATIALNVIRILVAASLAMVLARLVPAVAPVDLSEPLQRIINLLVALAAGGAAYVLLSYAFRVTELRLLWKRLFKGRKPDSDDGGESS